MYYFSALSHLDLRHNPLPEIPEWLLETCNVVDICNWQTLKHVAVESRKLCMEGWRITQLPLGLLSASCPNLLTHLSLRQNRFRSSELAHLPQMYALKTLDLSFNELSEIPHLKRFTGLTELFLDKNRITGTCL